MFGFGKERDYVRHGDVELRYPEPEDRLRAHTSQEAMSLTHLHMGAAFRECYGGKLL